MMLDCLGEGGKSRARGCSIHVQFLVLLSDPQKKKEKFKFRVGVKLHFLLTVLFGICVASSFETRKLNGNLVQTSTSVGKGRNL